MVATEHDALASDRVRDFPVIEPTATAVLLCPVSSHIFRIIGIGSAPIVNIVIGVSGVQLHQLQNPLPFLVRESHCCTFLFRIGWFDERYLTKSQRRAQEKRRGYAVLSATLALLVPTGVDGQVDGLLPRCGNQHDPGRSTMRRNTVSMITGTARVHRLSLKRLTVVDPEVVVVVHHLCVPSLSEDHSISDRDGVQEKSTQ
jgi:hypothetical protein